MAAIPSAGSSRTSRGTKFSSAPITVVLPAPPGSAPTRNDAPLPIAASEYAARSRPIVPASIRSTIDSIRPPR